MQKLIAIVLVLFSNKKEEKKEKKTAKLSKITARAKRNRVEYQKLRFTFAYRASRRVRTTPVNKVKKQKQKKKKGYSQVASMRTPGLFRPCVCLELLPKFLPHRPDESGKIFSRFLLGAAGTRRLLGFTSCWIFGAKNWDFSLKFDEVFFLQASKYGVKKIKQYF